MPTRSCLAFDVCHDVFEARHVADVHREVRQEGSQQQQQQQQQRQTTTTSAAEDCEADVSADASLRKEIRNDQNVHRRQVRLPRPRQRQRQQSLVHHGNVAFSHRRHNFSLPSGEQQQRGEGGGVDGDDDTAGSEKAWHVQPDRIAKRPKVVVPVLPLQS